MTTPARQHKTRILPPIHICSSALLGSIAFWLLDSWIDYWLFGANSWSDSMWPLEEGSEMWMRSLACVLIMTIGCYAARSITKQQQITKQLEEEIAERQITQEALFRSEHAIHELFKLTTTPGTNFNHKLKKLLEFGCQHFGLEFGIISHISNDNYTILQAVSPDDELKTGDQFPLGKTFCADTIKSPEPLFFDTIHSTKWQRHPAYQHFKLEAYFGIRIEVEERVYGTLNFTSASSPGRVLSVSDLELLQLMACWISRDLERHRHQARLDQAATVLSNTDECIVVADTDGKVLTINPAFSVVSGYKATEAVNQDISWLRNFSEQNDSCGALWLQIMDKGRWQGEYGLYCKDGKTIPIWLTVSTLQISATGESQFILMFSDISRLRHYQDKLAHLAHHDPLTDLPNRTLFTLRLDHSLEHAQRHNRTTALMMIDLDGFKAVNDSLGHSAGDQLLQKISQRIRACARDVDTVARLGGDEFTVILEEVGSRENVNLVANKILDAISSITELDSQSIHIGASIGVALYPQDAGDAENLCQAADRAMYGAKFAGKQQVQFVSPSRLKSVHKDE